MLVDRELAERLRGVAGFKVRSLRRVSVRGYDHLQPWLVRRDSSAAGDVGHEEYEDHDYDEPDDED
jgi:adenylate cyclase